MIKRQNGKKKKGFTLIELIIVLAVMAIIALIAIPNFKAVKDNSKIKADKQSEATIERTVLMLVADETITGNGVIVVTPETETATTVADTIVPGPNNNKTVVETIDEALLEVKKPQESGKAKYTITIKADGSVDAVTTAAK